MDDLSSVTIVLSIVGFIALVTILVLILYKPAKNLEVVSKFTAESEKDNRHQVFITVKNTGKKRLKMYAPYLKFSNGPHAQIYQVNPHKVHCRFPRIIKIGEEVSCNIDLTDYHHSLEKDNFHPSHFKVIIKDTVGMSFSSHSLDYSL
ncbi:MAG: hypothetical protein K9H49_02330 [Bacteroidales bacterium]|nr:hypothetical protein [Bacteroidales bacterium]MCF8403406.1 hypothetical protein [Bacteroidales bacterium]